MPGRLVFAIPLSAVLLGLSLLHAYWALGGRWGIANTIPTLNGKRTLNPTPVATWIVCALLAIAMILVFGKAVWIGSGLVAILFDAGVWGISLAFLLRTIGDLRTFGFFKTVVGTPFANWDTWLYSPLCLLLALLAAGLARSPRP